MRLVNPDHNQLLDSMGNVFPITPPQIDIIDALPPDHHIFAMAEDIPKTPLWIPRGGSFKHFTREERDMVRELLKMNPDAGYRITETTAVPIFTPRYPFVSNGQPAEAEKRRVYCTIFDNGCQSEKCDGRRAWFIDRGTLELGTYYQTHPTCLLYTSPSPRD